MDTINERDPRFPVGDEDDDSPTPGETSESLRDSSDSVREGDAGFVSDPDSDADSARVDEGELREGDKGSRLA